MLRSPKGKVLREIFKHANQHDLSDWSPFELHLLFLLMSIAGMDAHAPQYKARGRKKVRWITGKPDGKDCEICRARDGKEYLINEAPPCPALIGCRCCYPPVVDISH